MAYFEYSAHGGRVVKVEREALLFCCSVQATKRYRPLMFSLCPARLNCPAKHKSPVKIAGWAIIVMSQVCSLINDKISHLITSYSRLTIVSHYHGMPTCSFVTPNFCHPEFISGCSSSAAAISIVQHWKSSAVSFLFPIDEKELIS